MLLFMFLGMAKKKIAGNPAAEGFHRSSIDWPLDVRRDLMRIIAEEGKGTRTAKVLEYVRAGIAKDKKRLGLS